MFRKVFYIRFCTDSFQENFLKLDIETFKIDFQGSTSHFFMKVKSIHLKTSAHWPFFILSSKTSQFQMCQSWLKFNFFFSSLCK